MLSKQVGFALALQAVGTLLIVVIADLAMRQGHRPELAAIAALGLVVFAGLIMVVAALLTGRATLAAEAVDEVHDPAKARTWLDWLLHWDAERGYHSSNLRLLLHAVLGFSLMGILQEFYDSTVAGIAVVAWGAIATFYGTVFPAGLWRRDGG